MQKCALDAVVRDCLKRAADNTNGRSAATVYGGHEHGLRQTVLALQAGTTLAEHDNPGEATLVVLHGRVVLHAGVDTWEGRRGDLLVIPPARHSVEALRDSAILLSVAKQLHPKH